MQFAGRHDLFNHFVINIRPYFRGFTVLATMWYCQYTNIYVTSLKQKKIKLLLWLIDAWVLFIIRFTLFKFYLYKRNLFYDRRLYRYRSHINGFLFCLSCLIVFYFYIFLKFFVFNFLWSVLYITNFSLSWMRKTPPNNKEHIIRF